MQKKRIKDSLFFRVFINYAVIMILFSVIMGTVFVLLYRKLDIENNKSRLQQQARGIAKQVEEYQNNKDINSGLSYILAISTIESLEIWVIDNPSATIPLSPYLVSVDLSGIPLTEEQEDVIFGAFEGRQRDGIYYSDIHAHTMLSVGVPIVNRDGSIGGAVVLNTQMESIDQGVKNIIRVICLSVLVALALSFFVAIWFAKQLTVPFRRMRNMALRLAEGEYDKSTGIKSRDEIGELARTLDFLAGKLKENEIERERLERMRMDFFANVSHELRTPIAVVKAYTEGLVDKVVSTPEEVHQYYERMLLECSGMERLVSDLLTLSKMQNPDFIVEKEPVDIKQIFSDLVRGVSRIAEQKNISIELSCASDFCMMYGDYGRLRQMFLVILDNAIKFCGEEGKIKVNIWKDEKLHITIEDNGIGISMEDLPYVFEKFYKSNLRQNGKGSGLGLAIAKQIANKHGGSIEVESEPGICTRFTFTFDYIQGDFEK